jgi:hypothetical protein
VVSQELGESDAGRDSLRLTTLFEHVLRRSRGSIIWEAEAAAAYGLTSYMALVKMSSFDRAAVDGSATT